MNQPRQVNLAPVSPHGNPFMEVHLLASTSNALIRDGYISAPSRPGIGIDPEPEIVKKYKVA